MRFNPMLVSTFLFASVALAAPSQFHRQSLVQKPASASSDSVEYSSNWAGALYELDSDSFDFITGAVTVPHISGPINTSVLVTVGIDSKSCSSFLSVGVKAVVTPNGLSYQAVCQFNDDSNYLNVAISAGDRIQLAIEALDKTSGLVVVENLSNGQKDQRELQSSEPLCEQNAEWLVELVPGDHGTWLPLPDFSAVNFTDALASGKSGQYYGPQGANITEIMTKDGTVPTSVTVGEFSVTIKRV